MIRNIIFDWSGTLVDDLPAVLQASNYVLKQAGKKPMTLDTFRAEFQLPFTTFYDRHTPDVPMPQLEEWFHAEFRRAQSSVVPLEHSRGFLDFCRAHKIRMFLLSTVHGDHFRVQCQGNRFDLYLEKPYTDVWDKREKIHEILRDNNLKPEETLFIGDMEHDIATAKHGGVHSCAVLTGYNKLEQLRAAKPDVIVEHLSELRVILESNGFHLAPLPKTMIENGESRMAHRTSHSPSSSLHPRSEFPITTVGGLIYNAKKEVLMVRTHKWSNKWGIPGGKIKFGETSEAALRREIKEETNLKVNQIKFVLVQDCIHSKEFYKDAHFVLLNYTCRVVGKADVKLNHEAQEYCWVKLKDAKKLKLNKPTKVLIEAVVKSRKLK